MRYRKIVYTLNPEEEGNVMRAYGCRQHEVSERLEQLFLASLGTVIRKGAIGTRADALIASGDIEVGPNGHASAVNR